MSKPTLLPCDESSLRTYLRGLNEGERVIETGESGMKGRTGTVYMRGSHVCVMWDAPHKQTYTGHMGTAVTGGTRRVSEVLAAYNRTPAPAPGGAK